MQFAFCPLLAIIYGGFQKTLKNTCRNEPGKPIPLPEDRKEYLATYTTEYDDNYVLEPIAANDLQEFRELAQNQRERQIEADFDYNTIRRYCGNGNNSRTHETGE